MSDPICSTSGCAQRVAYVTKSLCRGCYKKQWREARLKGKTRPSTPDVVRFEARIAPGPSGCWQWTGNRGGGELAYGVLNIQGREKVYAHRWSYEYHRDEIPPGLEIDHLCRNTLCVNPWHLEPVTRRINAERMGAAKTECVNGHEYTPTNTYRSPSGERQCHTCRRAANRAANARRKALQEAS